MKSPLLIALAVCLSITPLLADKLTDEDRMEILRGLTAEYATVKLTLPRSKKPLVFESNGTWDKVAWEDARRRFGPAARLGDLVQITNVSIESDKLVFEINHGMHDKQKWYKRIEVGTGNTTTPIGGQQTNAPAGTYIALQFDKSVPVMKADEIKKMLAPILDFEKHSATESYVETLPAPVKQAIAEKKAIVGMDREQVLLAMGKPFRKTREVKDGDETEDWIYGEPPGKITFVTFQGSKVVKVKEDYAGLGGSTVDHSQVP